MISVKKYILISDLSSNTTVRCFFQEIDRKLENFKPGDLVVATGVKRSEAEDLVQIFKLEHFNSDEVGNSQTVTLTQ